MLYPGHILAQVVVYNLPNHIQAAKATTNPSHSREAFNQPEAAPITPNHLQAAPAISKNFKL